MPSKRIVRAAWIGIMAMAMLSALSGCGATPGIAEPLTPELAKNDPDAQLEFWHALPQRKAVSNDEALHALLLFADGKDDAADYAGRVEGLKQRLMLPGDFDAAAGEPVRRGTVAVALARTLGISGGLTMHLFGASPRYAVRELQYVGLFPPSSPQQTFSGAEFLGIIGRAEDFQRGQAEDALAPEPGTVDGPAKNSGANSDTRTGGGV
jgi:hypothetical protein